MDLYLRAQLPLGITLRQRRDRLDRGQRPIGDVHRVDGHAAVLLVGHVHQVHPGVESVVARPDLFALGDYQRVVGR